MDPSSDLFEATHSSSLPLPIRGVTFSQVLGELIYLVMVVYIWAAHAPFNLYIPNIEVYIRPHMQYLLSVDNKKGALSMNEYHQKK